MPCPDCVSVRAELSSQKEFMNQWFQVFLKQMQTMEEKFTSQTNDLKKKTNDIEKTTDNLRKELLEKISSLQVEPRLENQAKDCTFGKNSSKVPANKNQGERHVSSSPEDRAVGAFK